MPAVRLMEEEDFTSWKDYLWITPQLTLDDYGF